MDIAAIRQGLAAAADAIDGLTCYGFVPDAIVAPCFMACEVEINFDSAFGRGLDTVTVTCRVLVSRADDKAGQSGLDAYLAGSGSSSLKAALEAARGAPGQSALDGACDDFRVTRVQGYRLYEHAGVDYFGAELTVMCIGSGD